MSRLPNKLDFVAHEGDLDAEHAFKNFGDLNIDEAYIKFCSNPEYFQEDFMFMGPYAFEYYFSVIEKYISNINIKEDYDDCELWIIGCVIQHQLERNNSFAVDLRGRISHISNSMESIVEKSVLTSKVSMEVLSQWALVSRALELTKPIYR